MHGFKFHEIQIGFWDVHILKILLIFGHWNVNKQISQDFFIENLMQKWKKISKHKWGQKKEYER